MKKKTPKPMCRLPIDFGNESLGPVPVPFRGTHALRDEKVPAKKSSSLPVSRPDEDRPGCRSLGEGRSSNGSTPSDSIRVHPCPSVVNSNSKFRRSGFTLVEILVVLGLLSLIVYALMAVFASTQRAFRASLTQTDTLEGGRAVMDLIASDLQTMAPTYTFSNGTLASYGRKRQFYRCGSRIGSRTFRELLQGDGGLV